MKNKALTNVLSFQKEYGISNITPELLTSILEQQGYQLVEYNNLQNNVNVTTLVTALGIEKNIAQSKGFTYADSKRRIVFLHEDLSQEEKRIVLTHELGHIYCSHLSSTPILGLDVIEEYEANEFTHYLLHQGLLAKICFSVKKHKTILMIGMMILGLTTLGLAAVNRLQTEHNYYSKYYLTSTGNKYHRSECIFIKNKSTPHRMTISEFENGNYSPCEICLPE